MSLKLSLVSLSNTDLPIETKQQALIDIVLRFLTPQESLSLSPSLINEKRTCWHTILSTSPKVFLSCLS